MVFFADASRSNDHGQLAYLSGPLFGRLSKDFVSHTISWNLQKSGRPKKSIASAETLVTGESIDKGKVLAKVFKEFIVLAIELSIAVDSKDLFVTLSTCRLATHRSIRGDLSYF